MTVTHRKRQHQPEEISNINEPGYQIDCDGCLCNLTHSVRIKCADPVCQPDDGVDLCPACFCSGKEFREHKRHHAYRVVELHSYPIFSDDWGADEELLLIEGVSLQGLGNWEAIAEHIGTRTKEEVEEHYKTVYIDSPNWPLPLMDRHFDIDPSEFQIRKRRRISTMPTAPPPPKVAPTSAPGIHEVATFLPGRLEFEHELDNEAEDLVKDLEFGYCYEWGGDQIKEDEFDPDVKKRAKWTEDKQKARDDPFMSSLPMVNGNTTGVLALNGTSGINGIIKKEKDGSTRSEEPSTEDGEDDRNEENMPPIPFETTESLTFKLALHEMYAQRVEKREEAKQFMLNRGLLDYKKIQAADKKRPKEEKEIIHRLRPFAKLQTAEDYETFCADILYEAILRKRIAELQQYRRLGLLNEADIKKWEEDTYKRSQAKANMSRDYISSERLQQLRTGSARSSLGPEGRRDLDGRKSHDPEAGSKAGGTGLTGRRAPAPLNLANSPSLHLLTPAEQTLCSTLRILPKPYLAIKEVLVREYARRGGKLRRREARDLVKIDVNKTSRVWDFLVQAGYMRIQDSPAEAQAQKSHQQQSEPPENSAAGPSGTPATESHTPSPTKPVTAMAQPSHPPAPAGMTMPPPLPGPSTLPSSSFTFSAAPFPPPVRQPQ